MHVCVLADTFPSALDPWRGPYNRRQFECLAQICRVTAVAPIPWTETVARPAARGLTRGADHVLDDLPIYHPVLRYLPVIGRHRTWRGVLTAARRALRQMPAPEFDLIVATFAYPHGLAAKHLAAGMRIPYVVKVRGSDLHALPEQGRRRDLTAEALRSAAEIVAVSGNLAEIAADLGGDRTNIHVLTNGIDADRFTVMPRDEARSRLDIDPERRVAFYVGNLLPVKGPDVLLDSLAPSGPLDLSSANGLLALAGSGPMRHSLETHILREQPADAVRLLGRLAREEVALWMNAADCTILPSRDEGCPNVVLESLACGTPVVASRVGAVPDLLDDACGIIVAPGNPRALGAAVADAWQRNWDRDAIRSKVAGRSWEENAKTLFEILQRAVSRGKAQA